MDQALSLVQRYHLSLQSMHTWLDSAVSVLQRASSGVELDSQTDCVRELDEISAREKTFTAGLMELRALDPVLVNVIESGAMSELRENVEVLQLKKAEAERQMEAFREALQRFVSVSMSFDQPASAKLHSELYEKRKISSMNFASP